ncbi:MAG: recombination regulator RecX [Thiobacillus sp.]
MGCRLSAESSLRDRALRLLARREHSRQELAHKLEYAGADRVELAAVLEELEAKSWLSDRRFAESYVADHRRREGAVKLAHALRQRGIADDVISEVLDALNTRHDEDSEITRARIVWRKKFALPPSSQQERAKQMRFLQGRGFSLETIRLAMLPENTDSD